MPSKWTTRVVSETCLVVSLFLLSALGIAAQEQEIRQLPPPSERYAILVGIGKYDDKNISPLYGANNDAKVLADALTKYAGFLRENVRVLTSDQVEDRKPNRKNILDALSDYATKVSSDGLLLFAFSGHGTQKDGKSFLLPSDTYLRFLSNAAMSVDSITEILKEAAVKQVVMLLDACRGDPFAARGDLQKGFTPKFLDAFDLHKANIGISAFATLYATGTSFPEQNDGLAYQLSNEEMGVFTWVVTDELRKAGEYRYPLTLAALKDALENRVPDLVEKFVHKDKKQKPYSIVAGYKAEELILAGPADSATSLVPLSRSTVLLSKDGRHLLVTDEKTGQVSVFVRGDGPSIIGDSTTIAVVPRSEASFKSSVQLWSSRLLVAPNSEIYIADERRGGIIIFDAKTRQRAQYFIDFNSGKPEQMIVAPRRGEIYVIDGVAQAVGVIDIQQRKLVHWFPRQTAPRSLAITPDERKLYVSNEQPAPQGSISVVDLASRRLTQSIYGVNCPEGLAMSPDGIYMYVSTQCGLGEDPVFVVDTRTDTVIDSTPGLAVGLTAVAITPDGKKLYVGRGNFVTRDHTTGRLRSVPDQVSIMDTKTRQIVSSLPMNVDLLAGAPNSQYLLALHGPRLNIIDTKTDTVVKTIQFDTVPAGVAISGNGNKASFLYVWLPAENRLFFSGLSGVVPSGK